MERNALIQGDCIEGLSSLGPGSVDLVFADPPFNIGYDYDIYEDRKEADDYLAWTRKWVEQVQRVLKPDGTFWLAIGDDFAAELKVLAQRDLGFCCRSWVIWYYTFGVNCTKKFSRSHTHLFHFVKNPKSFTFNADAIRVPSARQLVYADGRANAKGRLPDDTWILAATRHCRRFQRRREHLVLPPRVRHIQGTRRLPRLPDAGAIARPHHPRLIQSRRPGARPFRRQRLDFDRREETRTRLAGI